MTKSQISLEMKIILNDIRLTALELNQAIYNLSETLKNPQELNNNPKQTQVNTIYTDKRFIAATDTEYVIGLN